MLHLQPLLVERIRNQVIAFNTVRNASVLAGLREIGPLLPACIVQPGAGEPTERSSYHLPFIEEQAWDVTVIIAHQASDSADGLTEKLAGDLLLGVLRAIHQWQPPIDQHQAVRYIGREQPYYGAGYAEFTLHFTAKVFIGTPNP